MPAPDNDMVTVPCIRLGSAISSYIFRFRLHRHEPLIPLYNYRGISLAVNADKTCTTVENRGVPSHQLLLRRGDTVLPKEQCGVCPTRSTVDILLIVRRLQQL